MALTSSKAHLRSALRFSPFMSCVGGVLVCSPAPGLAVHIRGVEQLHREEAESSPLLEGL